MLQHNFNRVFWIGVGLIFVWTLITNFVFAQEIPQLATKDAITIKA